MNTWRQGLSFQAPHRLKADRKDTMSFSNIAGTLHHTWPARWCPFPRHVVVPSDRTKRNQPFCGFQIQFDTPKTRDPHPLVYSGGHSCCIASQGARKHSNSPSFPMCVFTAWFIYLQHDSDQGFQRPLQKSSQVALFRFQRVNSTSHRVGSQTSTPNLLLATKIRSKPRKSPKLRAPELRQ